ncbi:peroxisomal membrane protein PEX14 isoform X1 [Physcomitrium patens]|uniref:Peroxisomal membrane protein PEX14 n=1 Tax=Physcomitrium patens TaxID=3218 RepID=A0A7I4B5A3_PHYPA|nr:peroxisomal membrane protein PEX14-like isoform X1 [Physcomitrium patens]|eukprot:XP_024396097.1 peroxisomal membrane protein PEX14-like isoform X1 [Physcomitrella patens]
MGISPEQGTEAKGVTESKAVENKPKTDPWEPKPQPVREDQVINAVNFLSHPKVRSSPIVHRRSFLEKKGLTKEEIDEAFRRVPDPPSSELATAAAAATGAQASVSSSLPNAPVQSQALVAQKTRELSWGQKLLGLGAILSAGAGASVIAKVYLLPKFKIWIHSIVLEEKRTDEISPLTERPPAEPPVDEAALAANAAAAAASEVAAAMREFSHAKAKESLQLGSIIKALETQTHELKSALSGMRDVVNNRNVVKYSELTPTPSFGRGRYRSDPWRTPEISRPSGMLADRSYAGVVIAPPPAERIDSLENRSDSVGS